MGAWLRNFVDDVGDEIHGIEHALDALGFAFDDVPITDQTPVVDARFDALVGLIERLLRAARPRVPEPGARPRMPLSGDGEFRDDERLIVFTEYKTTLDYLVRRLRDRYPADRVLTLFGTGGPEGMDEAGRENVKAAFNDPASQVRILVATDAASEGLNLHRTARYLLHYDCPWNPSRLEQRNGRLDRYGQSRDVTVHHFVSDTDADLNFLDHVIRKADEIREDLGSVNEVFDRAVHRRLIQGEEMRVVTSDLDRGIDAGRGAALEIDGATVAAAEEEAHKVVSLDEMATEIDFDDRALRDTLEGGDGRSRRPAPAPGRRGTRLLPGASTRSSGLARRHRRVRAPPRIRRRAWGSDAAARLQPGAVHRAARALERLPAPGRRATHALGPSHDAAGARRPHPAPISGRR